ncbi:MAG TPA: hypothetical protein VE544_01600, partial [Nitrososphaeraceae archaeon]|nr:hypothetical protein [Nitrososphaeraceae archaeon]
IVAGRSNISSTFCAFSHYYFYRGLGISIFSIGWYWMVDLNSRSKLFYQKIDLKGDQKLG